MYAYCENNPISFIDPKGELAYPGEIHNAVEAHIVSKYGFNAEQIIQYDFGWGRADLISNEGKVWEIKRDKPRQIKKGKNQVSKYTRNKWKNNPDITLSIGDFIESDSFTYISGDTTYYVTYRYAEDGVIAYDYSTQTDWQSVGEKTIAVIGLALAIVATAYSFGTCCPELVYAVERFMEAFA